MPGLRIKVTDAGRAALVNAENTGTNQIQVTAVGISGHPFEMSPGLSALPREVKRLSTIGGQVVADDTIHVSVRDESADEYECFGFGLYLSDGTLFANYSQDTLILGKSAAAMMLLAIDVVFADMDATQLSFGNPIFTVPGATAETLGTVELATPAEAIEGADKRRVITPEAMTAAINSRSGRARFSSSAIFVVPEGVKRLYVSGCAGGGGGGGGATRQEKVAGTTTYAASGGGGGGAGESAQSVPVNVTPDQSLSIVIGAGGVGGAGASTDGGHGSAGGNGGSTQIGNLLSLAGGFGGQGGVASAAPVTGVSGGNGYPAGSDSTSVSATQPYGSAGTGGSCAFGGGGPGGRTAGGSVSAGRTGFGFGAGGGGGGGVAAGSPQSSYGQSGAAGCPGFIFLEWC